MFQYRRAPGKGANELALRKYPVLSVDNNVGLALEGDALADALRANEPGRIRAATVRWLAVRRDRRSRLPTEAIEYEDGTEFNEGLAKYVEYRLCQVLEGRAPGAGMKWVQGFYGYGDLSEVRERLIGQMASHMRGEVNVNNDPYGASPLRMRLYYSGMAIAALLDGLSPGWHSRIFEPGTTLTQLAEEALDATPAELAAGLSSARHAQGHEALVEAKKQLESAGKKRIAELLTGIGDAPTGSVTVDYAALGEPEIAMAFTPFGIVAVDEDRTIHQLVPLRARLGPGCSFAQTEATPVLHDRKRRCFQFALPETVTRAQLAQALGLERLPSDVVSDLDLRLPGVAVSAERALLTWNAGHVVISCVPGKSP